MLAGVLLPVCLAPAKAMVELPGKTAPVLLTWLVLLAVARRWAVPGAIVAMTIVIVATDAPHLSAASIAPSLTWTDARPSTWARSSASGYRCSS